MTDSPLTNFNKTVSTIIDKAKDQYSAFRGRKTNTIKISVTTGYIGSKEGQSHNEIFEIILQVFEDEGAILFHDYSSISRQIQVGMEVHKKQPGLTCQQVSNMAVDYYQNLFDQ